jgi:galactokinase
MEASISQRFEERFGNKPLVAAAPGRVNLIGEHTDYNGGFVLPGAIDKKIMVAVAPNHKHTINLLASQFNEFLTYPAHDIHPVNGWASYFLGMIHYLLPPEIRFTGLDLIIEGDIPLGAGMSSSAAICSAFGIALNELYELKVSRMELALAGQQTEHHYVGVQCGIMDQFASLHGKAGHVVKLDCHDLHYEYIPFDYPNYRIVLLNTMVAHSLAASEYNKRRQECQEGISILQKEFPGIHSLRDASLGQLDAVKQKMHDTIYKRCSFVIRENQRVTDGAALLINRDLKSFGKLMFEAHKGLSRDYEVSCPESDWLVSAAANFEGVAGARQMGGGFGGCTINIIRQESVSPFVESMQSGYHKKFGKKHEAYITQIEEGARIIQD